MKRLLVLALTFAIILTAASPSNRIDAFGGCNNWICLGCSVCLCGRCEPIDFGEEVVGCTCNAACGECGSTTGSCWCVTFVRSCADCGRNLRLGEDCGCEPVPCNGCQAPTAPLNNPCSECRYRAMFCGDCGQHKNWCQNVGCGYAMCCGELFADCACGLAFCEYCLESDCPAAEIGVPWACPKWLHPLPRCAACSNPTFSCSCPQPLGLYISRVNADENWIEIRNPTDAPISSRGLRLSGAGGDWRIPAVSVEAESAIRVRGAGNDTCVVLKRMTAGFNFTDSDISLNQ